MTAALWRRALAEAVGTGLLVTVVVGSGIAGSALSPHDVGLQLLENSITTALGLAVLIIMLAPVSGAHFNPVVTLSAWWLGRGADSGLAVRDLAVYVPAQIAGGIAGSVLANLMYDGPAVSWSQTDRTGGHLWLGEVVATAGLVLLIFALTSRGPSAHGVTVVGACVGAYIGSAYWFTSSTSFANPAVTVARAFTDTFAGIAPASVPGFVVAQLAGAVVGVGLLVSLFPRTDSVQARGLLAAEEVAAPAGRP